MKSKKIICLITMMTLLMSQSAPAYALGIGDEPVYAAWWDKPRDWVDRAKDDVVDAVEDTADNLNDMINRTGGRGSGGVMDDPSEIYYPSDPVDIIDDAIDLGEGAVQGAIDWGTEFVTSIPGLFRGDNDSSEVDSLSPLMVNLNDTTNVQTPDTGHFIYGNNIKYKKLPFEVKENIRKILMSKGLTKYWANRIIKQTESEVEDATRDGLRDANVGDLVVERLPFVITNGELFFIIQTSFFLVHNVQFTVNLQNVIVYSLIICLNYN